MTATTAPARREGRRFGLFLVLFVGAAQVSATALGIGTPVQPLLSILFVLTCPGFLLFDLDKPSDVSARLLIAIGASLSINVAIATVVLVAEARWIAPVFALVLVAVAALPQERLRDAVTRVGSFLAGVTSTQLALPAGSKDAEDEFEGVPVADSSAIVEPDEIEDDTSHLGDPPSPAAAEDAEAGQDERTGTETEEPAASNEGITATPATPGADTAGGDTATADQLATAAEETAAPDVTAAAEVGVGEVPELASLEVAVLDAESAAPAMIDVNTADTKALQALPGVGPTLAAAIVDHRETHGPFETFSDLLDVPGIGPGKVRRLPDRARVGPAPLPPPSPSHGDDEAGRSSASAPPGIEDLPQEATPEPEQPGVRRTPADSPAGAAARAVPGPAPIDMNRASASDLVSLPGVGPSLARRIVAHRDSHGPFRSLRDLESVPGLGRSKTGDLDGLVVFVPVAMNINTATAAQLARVPGIGLELGSRIVSHRVLHGEFGSVDRLVDVSGIGPAKLEQLRPSLTV